MIYKGHSNKGPRAKLILFLSATLSACSTFEIKRSEHPDVVFQPRPVESLSETIAREQQGEDGCLVAGNLNKGERCRALAEFLSPPPPPDEPEF
jgi:hypothetical protein